MKVYSLLHSFFKQVAPTWRKTQLDNLTVLAAAIFSRKSLHLAELARAYPRAQRLKVPRPKHVLAHRLKRLRRFLNNPRPDTEAVLCRLTRLSYSVCRSPGLVLPVLLDPTYFGHYVALVAAIPLSGRALPIAWKVFPCNLRQQSELSQNHIVNNLVAQIVARLTQDIQAVFIGDRGFAIASFFRFLKKLRQSFVIRVDKETWITHEQYTGPMGGLPIARGGKRIWLEGVLYGKEERERVNLLAVWESKQEESWFIVTNLDNPKLAEQLYRKRMKIEHGFRDWKHHLHLKGTLKVETAERAERLLTAVILLYWFICLVGTRLNRPNHRAEVSYWGKPSIFTLALGLLQQETQAAIRAGQSILSWARDKLFALQPLLPRYKRRYLRFRSCLLPQSGSP